MDIDILRKDVDILNELIDEKTGVTKKVDPLAEWRALEPGRKVLSGSQNLYEIIKPWNGKELLGKQIYGHHAGFECPIYNLTAWQIIPLGPFDGSKLKVGDWVWVDGYKAHKNNGWHQVDKISDSPNLHVDHAVYNFSGKLIGFTDEDYAIHYYPPSLDVKETEEQRLERVYDELAKDKAFVAHAIKVVSGEKSGYGTCPHPSANNCQGGKQPSEGTVCFLLYGKLGYCPCYSPAIGKSRVKSDLLEIIKIAAGV